MEIDALSVSKINTNKDCPWKLALTYHIKHPDLRKPTIYTEKGIAVHEVLEKFANGDKEYKKNLLEYYSRSRLWELDQRNPDKGGYPHPQVKNCGACEFNINGVCEIAAIPIGVVNGCPRLNFLDDLELAEKVINREGDANIFNTRKILGAEVEFDLDISGVRVKGVIDLVTEVDHETLEIIDYKTGRQAKTSSTIQSDPQVRVYSLVAKMLWPQYKYRLMTLDYLRRRPISVAFSDEDDELTIKSILRQDKDIRGNERPEPLSYESWLCRFCIGRDRCVKMHESLGKGKNFKLPVLKCEHRAGDSDGSPPCWGSFSCINIDEVGNDLSKMRYSCQGHKEISRGGIYKAEEKVTPVAKPEEAIECD